MESSWTMAVARDDLSRVTLADTPPAEIADGEALLRVDRVGVTANNITYAVLGDAYKYWEFFPPADRGLDASLGLPPVWGFADVVSSTVAGVETGQRLYGYYPPATHLVVRPGRIDEKGFRDVSPHRAELPSPYNAYRLTTGDPAYEAGQEDLLILFRPLFFTSFMLADYVADFDVSNLVLSSASSKTAYAAAFELSGVRKIGLTSPGNLEFTKGLGCYDEVLTYEAIGELDEKVATAYLDLSGRAEVRAALREHLGDRLVRDVGVGLTSQTPARAPEVFFAPEQMRKRTQDWGRDGLDARFSEAWRRFAPVAAGWVDVKAGRGAGGLRDAWLDVLGGRTPARTGHVVAV